MNQTIKRSAMKFYKAVDRNPSVENISAYLTKLGYDVILFNTPSGDKFLEQLGLRGKKDLADAFTTGNSARFVFINNNLSYSDKQIALLHEVGHIELGHLGGDKIARKDTFVAELEANAFASEVLSPSPIIPGIFTLIASLLIAFSLAGGFVIGDVYQTNQQITTQEQSDTPAAPADIVYITATGTRYHTNTCIFTKDKVCAEIDRAQAGKIFSPCKTCNP